MSLRYGNFPRDEVLITKDLQFPLSRLQCPIPKYQQMRFSFHRVLHMCNTHTHRDYRTGEMNLSRWTTRFSPLLTALCQPARVRANLPNTELSGGDLEHLRASLTGQHQMDLLKI